VEAPSGRLPITFPQSVARSSFPAMPGTGVEPGTRMKVECKEGAGVGYRWFDRTGAKPFFSVSLIPRVHDTTLAPSQGHKHDKIPKSP